MLIGLKTKPSEATSDAQLLSLLEFTDEAPRRLIKAAKKEDTTRFVLAYRGLLEPAAARFRKHLKSASLSQLTILETSELSELIGDHTGAAGELKCGLGRALGAWLHSIRPKALACSDQLLAMELLLNPPIDIEVDTWCRIWRLVLVSSSGKTPPKPKMSLLVPIEAELDFIRSLLFAPLKGADKQKQSSSSSIESQLLEATDTDGTPEANALNSLGQWFAPIVRCTWWSRAFRMPVLSDEGQERFKVLTERVASFLRADGSFALEPAGVMPVGRQMMSLAAKVAGFGKKTEVGLLANFEPDRKHKSPTISSSQSDWARVASLRSSLKVKADQVAVRFDGQAPKIELCGLGKPLISGTWNSEFTSADRVVNFRKWSCSCWYSDEDGDYVEIESKSGGVRLERSIYLSRVGHFAVLTDCVRTTNSRPFQYETQMPLAQDVMSRADFVSREWRLHTGDVPTRVFPVCLEYDRVQNATGECTVRDEVLMLKVAGQGGATASVVIDWHRKRRELPAEWNRLSVTENRKSVPASAASAFRLRVGKRHQIVSYRNTSDSTELRAVLGQHTNRELILGLLGKSGVFEPLVLVDA